MYTVTNFILHFTLKTADISLLIVSKCYTAAGDRQLPLDSVYCTGQKGFTLRFFNLTLKHWPRSILKGRDYSTIRL